MSVPAIASPPFTSNFASAFPPSDKYLPSTTSDIANDTSLIGKAIDPVDTLGYDRAHATIDADAELSEAVQLAERAGDKDFRERLTAIIADLDRDPEAARNAIWREVFSSGIRNSALGSAANWYIDKAINDAAARLNILQPDAGLAWTSNNAVEHVRRFKSDQAQTFYRIARTPGLTGDQIRERFGQEGLFDAAIASGPAGDPHSLLHVFGAGLLGAGIPPIAGALPKRAAKRSADGRFEPETSELLNAAEVYRARVPGSQRYNPGVVSGEGVKLDGSWLRDVSEAPVPVQVADILRGRRFSSFDDLRGAFWKAVVSVPDLAMEFNSQNRGLMARGQPPKAVRSQHSPLGNVYHLHHINRIADGGGVYDMSNISVVTPRRHYEIHYGPLP